MWHIFLLMYSNANSKYQNFYVRTYSIFTLIKIIKRNLHRFSQNGFQIPVNQDWKTQNCILSDVKVKTESD